MFTRCVLTFRCFFQIYVLWCLFLVISWENWLNMSYFLWLACQLWHFQYVWSALCIPLFKPLQINEKHEPRRQAVTIGPRINSGLLNTAWCYAPFSPHIHIHIPLKYDVLEMEPYLFSMVHFGSLRYFKMGHLSCGLVSHLDKMGPGEDVNALHDEKGGWHLWPSLAFDLRSRYGATDAMGFLYLAYAGRPNTLREIPHLPHTVYEAASQCCKQPGCKKIDIYFTGFLFDYGVKKLTCILDMLLCLLP